MNQVFLMSEAIGHDLLGSQNMLLRAAAAQPASAATRACTSSCYKCRSWAFLQTVDVQHVHGHGSESEGRDWQKPKN